ncbi:hypothetical protein K431DRAFT_169863 [Polychaeton citri CBS 116435]|uniref:Uncharacterized protein n=1 Tax=Polychaeton citri CBS 116435 TaxID=1314669 RepID=A0A9P4PZX2_9PEZI|nr:hypothetical protein K431DRAFT_169863 [Polychaeton citri CBS 116435]
MFGPLHLPQLVALVTSLPDSFGPPAKCRLLQAVDYSALMTSDFSYARSPVAGRSGRDACTLPCPGSLQPAVTSDVARGNRPWCMASVRPAHGEMASSLVALRPIRHVGLR